jgi:hypothetical protein
MTFVILQNIGPTFFRPLGIHMYKYASKGDGRLSPDLLRGRGKLIGGDLDIDDEGSKHNINPLQSLHHNSVGYQSMHTRIDLTKKANP